MEDAEVELITDIACQVWRLVKSQNEELVKQLIVAKIRIKLLESTSQPETEERK